MRTIGFKSQRARHPQSEYVLSHLIKIGIAPQLKSPSLVQKLTWTSRVRFPNDLSASFMHLTFAKQPYGSEFKRSCHYLLVESEHMKASYFVGQELDWNAPLVPVDLMVELPFWMMVPNCTQKIEVKGHLFDVSIDDNFIEQHAGRD
jgi:hypothetical protein